MSFCTAAVPQNWEECLACALDVALDLLPGGKALKVFKGAGAKLKLATVKKQLARVAEKTIHFGKIQVPNEIFHKQIKPNILRQAGKFFHIEQEDYFN